MVRGRRKRVGGRDFGKEQGRECSHAQTTLRRSNKTQHHWKRNHWTTSTVMGQGDSKITPPSSLHLFNDEERGTLQREFEGMKPAMPATKQHHHHHQEPIVSFSSFQQNLLGNFIPDELQQFIYCNFIGSNTTEGGMTYAQFVDGVARVLKGDRQRFYVSLFSQRGTR